MYNKSYAFGDVSGGYGGVGRGGREDEGQTSSHESRVANVSSVDISIIVSLLLHVPYYEIMPTPLSLTVRSNRVNTQQ